MDEERFDFITVEHGEPVLCVCCALHGERQRECKECAEGDE